MVHDLRQTVRTLVRAPGFSLSAMVALALGIGANTAVFSVVHAVLLKPLPYNEPDRILTLSEFNPADDLRRAVVSRGTFNDWRSPAQTIESFAAYTSGGDSLWTIGERPQSVRIAAVSVALPRVLDVTPVLGRRHAAGSCQSRHPCSSPLSPWLPAICPHVAQRASIR